MEEGQRDKQKYERNVKEKKIGLKLRGGMCKKCDCLESNGRLFCTHGHSESESI